EELDPSDLKKSLLLKSRVEAVRDMRLGSKKKATQESASTPHLFQENRQPATDDIGIPAVGSASRSYYTAAHLNQPITARNKLYTAEDPTGLLFGLISSSMFITWQKTVGGRLKSDLNFANTLTWNTFPVPELSEQDRAAIINGGKAVLEARAKFPSRSLA